MFAVVLPAEGKGIQGSSAGRCGVTGKRLLLSTVFLVVEYFDYDAFDESGEQNLDVEGLLEGFQRREEQRLERELQRIERELEEREELHTELVEELESKLDWYQERLEKLYRQGRGKSGRRGRLKQKIDEFYEELRVEKRQRWRDVQELRREIRRVEKELDEVREESLLQDFLEG